MTPTSRRSSTTGTSPCRMPSRSRGTGRLRLLDPDDLGQQRADLAETLRELRKRSGLSGERLGRICGISQSKISKIENGRLLPSLTDVERILAALDVTPDVGRAVSAIARLAHTDFEND